MTQSPQWRRIRASAGSGKTFQLTSAYLALLAKAGQQDASSCSQADGDTYSWPEILGITFTNLAAAQMRDRVLTRLKKQALAPKSELEGWTPDSAAKAVAHLLRDPNAANIRTIDSLLYAIVRLSALDLHLPPQFDASFNPDEFYAPLLEQLGLDALERDPHLREEYSRACKALLHCLDFGFLAGDKVDQGILSALQITERFSSRQLADLSPISTLLQRRDQQLLEFQQAAHDLLELLPEEQASLHKRFISALQQACVKDAPLKDLNFKSSYFRKSDLTENQTGNKNLSLSAAALQTYGLLSAASLNLERLAQLSASALRLMPFIELARQMRTRLNNYCREQHLLLGEQMPGLAAKALADGGIGRAYCRLGARLTHLLVDEFQDTSLDQWRAMQPLAEEALAVGGSLVLVGDVKQAIYAWRGGEASLFENVMKTPELLQIAPQPQLQELKYNWRSRPKIIEWNNKFFSQLEQPEISATMLEICLGQYHSPEVTAEAITLLARDFAHCVQEPGAKPDAPQTGGLVRIDLLPPGRPNPFLAELLPQRVAELAKRYQLSQICILTRTNKEVEFAAQCLLQNGYPVVTEGSLYLSQQAIVIQAAALLEWLDAPENDLALWTLLRGGDLLPPDFPLRGATLDNWAAGRLNQQTRQALSLALANDFPEIWQNWFAPLQDAASLLTPYDAMREIVHRWQVLQRRPTDAGFVLRFLEVLHRAEQQGHTDLPSFLDYWQRKGHEEKAPLPPGTEAISLMTMHKAKGLQFDVVLMPWLNFDLKADSKPILWQEDDLLLICEPRKSMGQSYARLKAAAAREAFNLLYVGWTRAVNELHAWLPQRKDEKRGQGFAEALRYLLDQCGASAESGWQFGTPAPDLPLEQPRPKVQAPVLGGSRPEGDWKPMGWLPRLRIFRNSLEQLELSPALRGTILHRCLELLTPGQSSVSALNLLIEQVLCSYNLGQDQELAGQFAQILAWYVGLPDFALWHDQGSPEHSLLDAEGNVFRVDRLVRLPAQYLALEYKSGHASALPVPEHTAQLGNYLQLLHAACGLPCSGKLIYLDQRQIFELNL